MLILILIMGAAYGKSEIISFSITRTWKFEENYNNDNKKKLFDAC